MIKTVNRVTLIGHVERDPEVREFPSGGQVCNLTVKTTEQWADRNTGEQREFAQWNRVAIYVKPLIDLVTKNVRQGDLIYIEGRLETRKYQDNSGNDQRWTEIAVKPYHGSVSPLGSPSEGASNLQTDDKQEQYQRDRRGSSYNQNEPDSSTIKSSEKESSSDVDDQIPF